MVKNKARFEAKHLAAIFHPDNLLNVEFEDTFECVYVDSRVCSPNSIFVALEGENSDGHDYINSAFENGADMVVASKEWYSKNGKNFPDKKFLIAEDTLRVLQELAKEHRRNFKIPIIAVAGSNGKTSTKEMIAKVLEEKFNVLKTHANYNNQLGVPLMMLAIDETHQVAVIEIGTNMPGEIALLSSVLMPTHGLITNIGKEHLELLEDLDGVENEETALFAYLLGRGNAFINLDDERLSKYIQFQHHYTTYGMCAEARVQGSLSWLESFPPIPELTFKIDDRQFSARLQTFGIHSAYNAIAATAVAFEMGLTDEEITKGLESFIPVKHDDYARMAFEKIGELGIINDCYNANPSSIEGALDNLHTIQTTGQKIAVLGDMLELGEKSQEEHIYIIKKAVANADLVMLFGEEFGKAVESVKSKKIEHFSKKEQLAEKLLSVSNAGDTILIKGSRGKKMEEIIVYLENNL